MPEEKFIHPKVSIVIPYYNGREYISETVGRVLKVTHNQEIIIVNDGSTDDSGEFLYELYRNIPQVRIIKKENGGIVSARNCGIEHAYGEYIMFVDQDDYPMPQTIDKAIQVLDENKCSLLIWATDQINDQEEVAHFTEISRDIVCERQAIITELLPILLFSRSGKEINDLGQIWACLFRKDFIDENHINFRKFIDFEDDNIFILDSLCTADSIALISNVGYMYRVREDSYSRGVRHYTNYQDRLEEYNKYYLNRVENIGLRPEVLESYSCFLKQMTVYKLLTNYAVKQNKSEWETIKNTVKNYRIAFQTEMLLKSTRFNRFVYWSIKLGIPKAVVVAYGSILKRKYGNWTVIER